MAHELSLTEAQISQLKQLEADWRNDTISYEIDLNFVQALLDVAPTLARTLERICVSVLGVQVPPQGVLGIFEQYKDLPLQNDEETGYADLDDNTAFDLALQASFFVGDLS